MSALELTIGNRNYSSWSLRPWLALRMGGFDFTETVLPLMQEGHAERFAAETPAGKVPFLTHGDLVVWETLAICEYLAELKPEAMLWPVDLKTRARARAVSTEMAAGFFGLRNEYPVNIRRRIDGITPSEAAAKDIARVHAIWSDCRARAEAEELEGPFLFGHFTIADAMYAPVAWRFETYGLCADETARSYMDSLFALQPMQDWEAASKAEAWVIEGVEL